MSNVHIHCDSVDFTTNNDFPMTLAVSDKCVIFTQGNIYSIELVEIDSRRVLKINTAEDRWVIEDINQQRLFLRNLPRCYFDGAFKLMALYQDLCSFNEDF